MRRLSWPGRRRIYAGWSIVAALSFTETISWGILYYGFGVFLPAMRREFGWPTSVLSVAFSLALLLSGLFAPIVGRWLDEHGPRLVMTAGSLVATGLLLAWAHVSTVVPFYLVWAGIGCCMACVLYDPAFAVVAKWFWRRRRAALTTLTLVAGLASVIFSPLNAWLIAQLGWRHALVVLAVILGLGTVPLHALVLRPAPSVAEILAAEGGSATDDASSTSQPERSMELASAVRTAAFWGLTSALVLSALLTATVSVYLVSYLVERGMSVLAASSVTGLVGLAQLPGRMLFVPLARVLSERFAIPIMFWLQAAGLALLLVFPSPAGAILAVALFGIGNGMITLVRAARPAELFGSARYGSVAGVIAFWATLARAVAPALVGLLVSHWRSFTLPFWLLVVAGGLAGLAAWLAEWRAAQVLRLRLSTSRTPPT